MRLFYLQKPILDVDYQKLCDAFVYTVFFRYLEKPAEKKIKNIMWKYILLLICIFIIRVSRR